MTAESAIRITCKECNATITAKPEWAGKRAKCPRCAAPFEIPAAPSQKPNKRAPVATEKQKEFAESLGITFPADITRPVISKLIDEAVAKRDEERFSRLDDVENRESEAYQRIRKEVLAEIDADEWDCRLSKAEPSQMVRALSEREFAAVLITIPFDAFDDDDHFADESSALVSCPGEMTQYDCDYIMVTLAMDIMARRPELNPFRNIDD